MPRYYAIVPAAGSGSRLGAATPKQYLPLAGRPLLYHALAALCGAARIARVWVVLAPDDELWGRHDWLDLGHKLETVRCGGATRAESVANGLAAAATAAADADWVLVHDAARPGLDTSLVDRLLDAVADDPVGGLLALPVADTLKRADASGRVVETIARTGLWQAQTPQMFRYGLLRAALAQHPEVTDEAGAIEAAGHQPLLVPGEAGNFKVTYASDLPLAELMLKGRRLELTGVSA